MNFELMVGLRYTRAKRRERFVGVNSAVSMVGTALGVWALIVILSVMNGLQGEIRGRILGVASHVQLLGADGRLADWREAQRIAASAPHVVAAAPFVEEQAMLSARVVRPAQVRGVLPQEEARVADLGRHMASGSLQDLRPGAFRVVLGEDLARSLGALPGDKVALIAPQGTVTPAGVIPRLKQFTVSGVFAAGIPEADGRLALIHLADAQALYRMGEDVTGVRLKLDDLFAARAVARELQPKLPAGATAVDWTQTHAAFFHAVEIEKRVMFIILGLIVLVAAINIVSTLVVAVADKQADIAILRTIGAAPWSIVRIFMVQGMVIGVIGTAVGLAGGLLTAANIDVIVPAIENALRFRILARDVYLIPELPSQIQAADVVAVVLMALALSFLATIWPSLRAARTNPAEALRYE
ncbi:MAG TPA: lipoprotein-releasing ABC transporter permease subunit [Burkholderiales bacterium]|jgi:lipoprotein-releasing system permease protein